VNRILFAFLLAAAWIDGHAQSSLPPCPTDTSVVWTNCFGTFTNESGIQYVGGFKNDARYGQGSLISAKGYTLVEGFWWDNTSVDVDGLQWKYVSANDEMYFFCPIAIYKTGWRISKSMADASVQATGQRVPLAFRAGIESI